jgi:prepilin-type N-terminal cleavage/methylation domain-containing protein
MSSLRNQQGFSLIELAVVVIIAGLVLAITTPAINRFLQQARLRDSASRLAGEMRLVRQRAVTNSSRAWFYTVNGTNQYWVGEQRWTGGTGSLKAMAADTTTAFAGTQWKGPYNLPSTVRVVEANWGGINYFWYTPNGRPNQAGSMKVISIAGTPDTVTINVDLSGAVWK